MSTNKKSKTWKIVDFNVTETRKQFYRDLDKRRMAMGSEICPKTGKPHLQIFITFARTMGWEPMKKLLGGKTAFEAALVGDWNYELKDMKYELDDRRIQGKRKDIDTVKEMLAEGKGMRDIVGEVSYQAARHAELLLKYKEKKRMFKPNVIWIWGPTGVGKTRAVYDGHKEDDIFVPINFKWWEGYDAHPVVIIDDFRKDFCKFHELLKLLDRYPYRVETKGGSRQLLATTIYVTCPYQPGEVYGNRSSEDQRQLLRRITNVIHQEPGTEVEKGNINFLDGTPKNTGLTTMLTDALIEQNLTCN